MEKEEQIADAAAEELEWLKPDNHGRDQAWFSSMLQQGEFRHELPLAGSNRWVNIVEKPIISCHPNAPWHQNNDLHEEWNDQPSFDEIKDLQERSCGGNWDPNDAQQALVKLHWAKRWATISSLCKMQSSHVYESRIMVLRLSGSLVLNLSWIRSQKKTLCLAFGSPNPSESWMDYLVPNNHLVRFGCVISSVTINVWPLIISIIPWWILNSIL